eukprot:s405_g15.t1
MSNTLIVRTVALVSIFTAWLNPRDRMILDGRVRQLELIIDTFRNILGRIGIPLHAQSIRFVFSSAVQALWMLEQGFFPDLEPQTDTSLTTPAGDPRSFAILLHDPTFQPIVQQLRPTYLALHAFYTYLDINFAKEDHSDIFESISDSLLILENISLVFQLNIRQEPVAPVAVADPVVNEEAAAASPENTPADTGGA